ncbi:hypothetical protein PCASD_08993 [Puccinia coronata f. sp. avenae]|uniref:Uncharacterized protein n=1 Tax=Puccinia coronata f. sp. avenae TaxID=200324 RepID=A0A2N5UKP0_9BASI|nr:hypothetical protein PCASD_08993 [Puccinia coronata f. sp. avenae]
MENIREVFLWILGIESLLNLSSLGARARAGASIKLSLSKRLALNALLFAVILIPVAIVLWISIVTTSYLRDIETVSEQIIVALLKRAPTYHAGSYSPLNLLETLKPVDNLLSRSELTASHIKLMLPVYLSQHLIISCLYLPTSIILLRNLKDRHRSLASGLLTRAGGRESAITERGNLLLQVRKRLSTQIFLIHLEEILYLPPIIYLFFAINGVKFFSDPTWVLLDQIAMHGPAAFLGNIVLTCAIQNTLFTIRIPKFKSAPQKDLFLHSNPEEMDVHQAIKFQSNDPTDTSSLEPQTLSLDFRTETQDYRKVHERPCQ